MKVNLYGKNPIYVLLLLHLETLKVIQVFTEVNFFSNYVNLILTSLCTDATLKDH